MQRKLAASVLMGLLLSSPLRAAPLGTAFTYQGQLIQSGVPANGPCDLEAKLFDAATAGAQVSSTQTVSVTLTNGLLTTQLDFGASAFTGQARWLEVAVRCPAGSGGFTTLGPRQQLTGAPYALYAPTAGVANTAGSAAALTCTGCVGSTQLANGGVAGTNIADGTITGAKLAPNAINSSHILDGTITGADIASSTITRDNLTGGCPSGSRRYGIWCIDDAVHAGISSHNTAMQTCHNEGKTLCPLTALQMCDIVEAGGDCATLTDGGASEQFWTSDVHFAASIYGSTLNNNVIYDGNNNFFVVPEDDSPFTHKFFCCQLTLKP